MKSFLRSLPVLALLVGAAVSQVVQAAPTATRIVADPNDDAYNQGVDSAVSYINNGQRSYDDAAAERTKAEGLRDQATTLREYYYLSGYIDRLGDYISYGS